MQIAYQWKEEDFAAYLAGQDLHARTYPQWLSPKSKPREWARFLGFGGLIAALAVPIVLLLKSVGPSSAGQVAQSWVDWALRTAFGVFASYWLASIIWDTVTGRRSGHAYWPHFLPYVGRPYTVVFDGSGATLDDGEGALSFPWSLPHRIEARDDALLVVFRYVVILVPARDLPDPPRAVAAKISALAG